jgi:uncharacterized protein YeaO (DUF488 family)
MDYLLVRHRVKDFPSWKTAYDEDLPQRQKAELSELRVLHAAEDPNDVTLLFQAADVPKARAFATSAALKETMQKAGVVGPPEITYFKD